MSRAITSAGVLVASLIGMATVCAIVWALLVQPTVYDCTDPGFIDYFTPGDWVHIAGGHPIAVVPRIVHGRSMSEPDTIRQGWSVVGLWCLWSGFVSVSVLVSVAFARKTWVAGRERRERFAS